jgi:Uracil DNA glycosylase superfamily
MSTFADRIISFCNDLDFTGSLPEGISIMNPFRNNPEVSSAVSKFYHKYYSDNKYRHLILGINPGRFGAGTTGIPFTDTFRLEEKCGISIKGFKTRETSSVFIYQMIDQYGGPGKFFKNFYISAISPLGFTAKSRTGREINYNYYDSRELTDAVFSFIIGSLNRQLEFGIERDICFCLGKGKNYNFLSKINEEYKLFGKIEPLEHPRFIMQYRAKKKQIYIEYYIQKFKSV